MSSGGAPPGWYPDPAGTGGLRWWDGSVWTEHSSPRPVMPLEDEVPYAGRAKIAVLVGAIAQLVGYAGMRANFRNLMDAADELSRTPTFSPLELLGNLALLVAGVLFLIWFYKAASNAQKLGLPARRDPSLATASFIIPVVSLWWPYQSTKDLMPADDPGQAYVLPWWLLWLVGGFVSIAVVIASVFVDGPAGWYFLFVPAIISCAAALAAGRVIDAVVESHRRLAGSSGAAFR